MKIEGTLPDELAQSGRCLEERLHLLRVPSRAIAETEWNSLVEGTRKLIPNWLIHLLARYPLAGAVLTYPEATGPFERELGFWQPAQFARGLAADSVYLPLCKFGFLPFADESDGNVWVVARQEEATGPVYLVDLSAWDGGEPSERNGLVFASSRLALLLASMAISRGSYGQSPTSVLWYPEK